MSLIILSYFNPRPREEGDKGFVIGEPPGNRFNPRPREEGDFVILSRNSVDGDFNPRPREEGDKSLRITTCIC